MRRPHVRGRRHGGHVGGHGQEDPRRRARAPWERRTRRWDLGVENALDHGAHGALEPTRSIELNHERLGAVGLRPLDGGGEQADGDRSDGAVDYRSPRPAEPPSWAWRRAWPGGASERAQPRELSRPVMATSRPGSEGAAKRLDRFASGAAISRRYCRREAGPQGAHDAEPR